MFKLLTLFFYVQNMSEQHINLIDSKTENIVLLLAYPFLADFLISSEGFYHYLDLLLGGVLIACGKMIVEFIAEKVRKK